MISNTSRARWNRTIKCGSAGAVVPIASTMASNSWLLQRQKYGVGLKGAHVIRRGAGGDHLHFESMTFQVPEDGGLGPEVEGRPNRLSTRPRVLLLLPAAPGGGHTLRIEMQENGRLLAAQRPGKPSSGGSRSDADNLGVKRRARAEPEDDQRF